MRQDFRRISIISLAIGIASVVSGPSEATEFLSGSVQHSDQLPAVYNELSPGQSFAQPNFGERVDDEWFEIPSWLGGTWRTIQLSRFRKKDHQTGIVDREISTLRARERETFGYQLDRLNNVWTLGRSISPVIATAEVFLTSSGDCEPEPILGTETAETRAAKMKSQTSESSEDSPQTSNVTAVDSKKLKKSKRPKMKDSQTKQSGGSLQQSPASSSSLEETRKTFSEPPPRVQPSKGVSKVPKNVTMFIARKNYLVKREPDRITLRSVDAIVTILDGTGKIDSIQQREVIRTITSSEPGVISITSDVRVFDQQGFPQLDESLLEFRMKEREFEVQDEIKGISLYSSFTKFLQKIGKLTLSPDRSE